MLFNYKYCNQCALFRPGSVLIKYFHLINGSSSNEIFHNKNEIHDILKEIHQSYSERHSLRLPVHSNIVQHTQYLMHFIFISKHHHTFYDIYYYCRSILCCFFYLKFAFIYGLSSYSYLQLFIIFLTHCQPNGFVQ